MEIMTDLIRLIALSAVIGGVLIVVAFVIYVVVVYIMIVNKENEINRDAEQANKDSLYQRAKADAAIKQEGQDLDVTRSLL